MTAFRNNLQKGDRVVHAETKRPGTVYVTPRESSRNVSVVWQGCTGAIYVDVMKLRLVLDDKGTIDEFAPVDGEPPSESPERPIPSAPRVAESHKDHALQVVRDERSKIKIELAVIEADFKKLRAIDERLAETEKILTAP